MVRPHWSRCGKAPQSARVKTESNPFLLPFQVYLLNADVAL